jgi:hypothetical protein
VVSGVGDVNGDDGVGCQLEADHARAFQADFLLDRTHRVYRRVDLGRGGGPQPLRSGPDPDPVVHPAGGHPRAREILSFGREGDRVADVDQFRRFLAVLGSDIDVLIGDVRQRVVGALAEVDRRLPDDTGNRCRLLRPIRGVRSVRAIGVDPDVLAL